MRKHEEFIKAWDEGKKLAYNTKHGWTAWNSAED